MSQLLDVPRERREALQGVLTHLLGASCILLTTHVNADGDGAGSEAALAIWLAQRGKRVRIANPTAYPDVYRYLLPDASVIFDPGQRRGVGSDVDLVGVLDTGETRRIGRIAPLLDGRKVVIVDHHPAGEGAIRADVAVVDTSACATGELIFDLLHVAEGEAAWPDGVAQALYAAIVTDTGSFRFANTTPRTHAIAAELLRRGVDPEAEYRRLFGRVPLKRVRLLRAALDTLEVDETLPIAWMTLPRSLMDENEANAEDLEGVIEHARSIEGTEVALLFRETVEGGTKVSLRSNGLVDVNAIARQFGGGGHVKASGILMGAALESARAQVLEATRLAVSRLADATATAPAPPSGPRPTPDAAAPQSDAGVGDSPASA